MRAPIGCQICVGLDIPSSAIDPNAYFTLDRNGARWDVFRQPSSGDFTGHSLEYNPGDGPLLLATTEEQLWEKIDQFAKGRSKLSPNPTMPPLPTVPFKAMPTTPVYGPPSPPVGLPTLPPLPTGLPSLPGVPGLPTTPPAPVGMPNPLPPPAPAKKTEEPPANYALIGGIAVVTGLIFLGTLNVK